MCWEEKEKKIAFNFNFLWENRKRNFNSCHVCRKKNKAFCEKTKNVSRINTMEASSLAFSLHFCDTLQSVFPSNHCVSAGLVRRKPLNSFARPGDVKIREVKRRAVLFLRLQNRPPEWSILNASQQSSEIDKHAHGHKCMQTGSHPGLRKS